jgi:Transposase DDE domain
MERTVALRERGQVAVLLNSVQQSALQRVAGREPDPRNLRTWRQWVLGVWVARSTRLLTVARVIAPQRRVRSVKAAAEALGYFLDTAQVALRPWSTYLLEASWRALDPSRVTTYRGQPLLVIDPTEYAKRSRGRGKCNRQMQHVGRVRRPTKGAPSRRRQRPASPAQGAAPAARPARVATTSGYVDVWAGLVLRGKQFFPLGRLLYSNRHPHLRSQNRVEEAVLGGALALARRWGLAPIAVGDRGLGRKELLIRLAQREQAYVFRVDPDIPLWEAAGQEWGALAVVLAQQPSWGEAWWYGGEEGPVRCAVRVVRAAIRFSRTGRQADYTEATLNFVELWPLAGTRDPLVLATTLPVQNLADARGIAWVYGQRWTIETGFETLKAWGLGRFMVRGWQAIDRLLWVVAIAYTLLLVLLHAPRLARLRRQACALLRQQAVLGRDLTVGKLAEAISFDVPQHRRAWAALWLL